jgi:hypothetical protein
MHWQEQLQCRPDSAVVVNDQYLSFVLCHNPMIAFANLTNFCIYFLVWAYSFFRASAGLVRMRRIACKETEARVTSRMMISVHA